MKSGQKVLLSAAVFLGLPILFCGGCFTLAVITGGIREATMTDEQKAERTAEQEAAKLQAEADLAQAEIEGMRIADERHAAAVVETDRRIAAMMELVNADPVAVEIIEGVQVTEAVCMITMKNVWHAKLKQIRLQDAQALYTMWRSVVPPEETAAMGLVDLRGNSVGGLGITGVWVND